MILQLYSYCQYLLPVPFPLSSFPPSSLPPSPLSFPSPLPLLPSHPPFPSPFLCTCFPKWMCVLLNLYCMLEASPLSRIWYVGPPST